MKVKCTWRLNYTNVFKQQKNQNLAGKPIETI